MASYQVFKYAGNPLDVRYLTRTSDGAARWTLTRGDANHYTKAEAEAVAAHYGRVFIGHTLGVVRSDRDYKPGAGVVSAWTGPPVQSNPLPKAVRELALKHKLNVGRDEHGNYFVRDPASGKVLEHTVSAQPTAAQALAMIRRYLASKNPRRRARARARAIPPARGVYRARFTGGGPRTGVTFQASSDKAAVRYAVGLLRHKIGAKKCVSVQRVSSPRSSSGRRRRNPSQRDEAERAAQALEDFTGHPAKLHARRPPKIGRAAWALGKLTSVSYIATRDGETVEYVHDFRSRSRPQLVSNADGSQLYMLGGAYSVTDRGIVDA